MSLSENVVTTFQTANAPSTSAAIPIHPMTTALLPVEFTAPLVAPVSPYGLAAATTWTETAPDQAQRWVPAGVQFRLRTHRPTSAFGIWGAA